MEPGTSAASKIVTRLDMFKTCRVRQEAHHRRAGEFAKIIGRTGACFALEFADGTIMPSVHIDYLERFCL